MQSVRLPPGQLGLELEPSSRFGGQSCGIQIKGWKSAIFSLASLPSKSRITSIDGTAIDHMSFKEAVEILKTSHTRELLYSLPSANSPAGSGSPNKRGEAKFTATLKFQDLEKDKENTPTMSLSNSPTVPDFWTVAKKVGAKTRSPNMRFRGVATSPKQKRQPLRSVSNNGNNATSPDTSLLNKADEWVCIPLADQFNSSSNSSSPAAPKQAPVLVMEEEKDVMVTSNASRKMPTVVDVSMNTSPVVAAHKEQGHTRERVTPLKGKITLLEASVRTRDTQICQLGGTVQELKSSSRGSAGRIALLKYQLSKNKKAAAAAAAAAASDRQEEEGAVTTTAVPEKAREGGNDNDASISSDSNSRVVLAHLKMCRVVQAMKRQQQGGGNCNPQYHHHQQDASTNTDHVEAGEVVVDGGVAMVNTSSGTACDSSIDDSIFNDEEGGLQLGEGEEEGDSDPDAPSLSQDGQDGLNAETYRVWVKHWAVLQALRQYHDRPAAEMYMEDGDRVDAGAAAVNVSSGTAVDVSTGTIHESDCSNNDIEVEAVSSVSVDAAVQCEEETTAAAVEVVDMAVQCEAEEEVEENDSMDQYDEQPTLPYSTTCYTTSTASVDPALEQKVCEQERFIGLLTLQMHAYVDTHIEMLRRSASSSSSSSSSGDSGYVPRPSAFVPAAAGGHNHSHSAYAHQNRPADAEARAGGSLPSRPLPARAVEELQSIPLVAVAPEEVQVEEEEEGEGEGVVAFASPSRTQQRRLPPPSPQATNIHISLNSSEDAQAVHEAFATWRRTKDTPTSPGLSPAAFRTHIERIRGDNCATRSEIEAWGERFREMREDVAQEPAYFRL
jgi:hypothetical protein